MACNVNLTAITTSCTDIYSGGLKSLVVYNKSDLPDVVVTPATLEFVSAVDQNIAGSPVSLAFNTKDGFSNFSDVSTKGIDGTGSVVPTIQIEFPRMDSAKAAALMSMANSGAELVAFIETAAGTRHMVGYEFGLIATSIDGNTGATRADKNRFQLTLSGDENYLAYQPTADQDWDYTHG